MDRHVTPRKVVRIGEKAHKKAREVQQALTAQGWTKVTIKSVIEQALDKELKELREVE